MMRGMGRSRSPLRWNDAQRRAAAFRLYADSKDRTNEVLRKREERDQQMRRRGGFVYFIPAGEGGDIKIGWAIDPDRRLGELQTANSEPLRIIGKIPGTRTTEYSAQCHFQKYWKRGEWYRPAAELIAFAQAGEAPERWHSFDDPVALKESIEKGDGTDPHRRLREPGEPA